MNLFEKMNEELIKKLGGVNVKDELKEHYEELKQKQKKANEAFETYLYYYMDRMREMTQKYFMKYDADVKVRAFEEKFNINQKKDQDEDDDE